MKRKTNFKKHEKKTHGTLRPVNQLNKTIVINHYFKQILQNG